MSCGKEIQVLDKRLSCRVIGSRPCGHSHGWVATVDCGGVEHYINGDMFARTDLIGNKHVPRLRMGPRKKPPRNGEIVIVALRDTQSRTAWRWWFPRAPSKKVTKRR